ncbi:MAG TPA: hypothetical protein VJ806_11910 [Luteimonas sp.]|nr:hypothetical protein [Luteimonas sp.]
MNAPDNDKLDQTLADEREWLAQEQAMRDERVGIVASGSGVPEAQYRVVARALREPPAESLPPDFARQVARMAETRDAAGAQLESWMLRALGAILGVSGVAALAYYGREAVAGVDPQMLQWTLAIGACAVMTWSLDWARRWMHRDEPMRHA